MTPVESSGAVQSPGAGGDRGVVQSPPPAWRAGRGRPEQLVELYRVLAASRARAEQLLKLVRHSVCNRGVFLRQHDMNFSAPGGEEMLNRRSCCWGVVLGGSGASRRARAGVRASVLGVILSRGEGRGAFLPGVVRRAGRGLDCSEQPVELHRGMHYEDGGRCENSSATACVTSGGHSVCNRGVGNTI